MNDDTKLELLRAMLAAVKAAGLTADELWAYQVATEAVRRRGPKDALEFAVQWNNSWHKAARHLPDSGGGIDHSNLVLDLVEKMTA